MSSRIKETLNRISLIDGYKESFDGFDFLKIVIDPRRIFDQGIIDENPEMPKVIRDAIVARILQLRNQYGFKIVNVNIGSRAECSYPQYWTMRLIYALNHHGIFVESDDQKFSPFNLLYSSVVNIKEEEDLHGSKLNI